MSIDASLPSESGETVGAAGGETLKTSSGLRKIGSSQILPTFATSVAIQACTVVQGILLARVLGSEGRGQFAAAILWPSFFAAVGSLGVTVVLSRRAAHSDDLPRVMRTAAVLALITGAITVLLCAAIQWTLLAGADGVVKTAAYVFTPFILFNHLALSLAAVDHGAGRFAAFNLTRLLVNPLYLVMLVALWLAGIQKVEWYVAALMMATIIVALVRVGSVMKEAPLRGPVLPLGPVVRESIPFGAVALLNPVLQTADKAILFYFLGATELGMYVIALTAASVINSMAAASSTVSFGMSAQAQVRDGFETMARMFRMTLWIWIIGGAALALVIPFLLPLIYGSEFSAAVIPAIVLIPAAALAGQAGLLEESMRAQGRALLGVKGRLAGLAVLLMAGWALARIWGVLGVALATIAAQAISLTVLIFAARDHYHHAKINQLVPRIQDVADLVNYVRRKMGLAKHPA